MSAFRATLYAVVGRMRPWQRMLAAILPATAIVAVVSLLLQGRVTWDTLLTGAVAALVAAWLIGRLHGVGNREPDAARLQRYEFMVNAVGDMMSVINRAHHYEAVNEPWCAAMARRCDAVIGLHVAQVWGELDYRDHIAPHLRQCFDQGHPVALHAALDLPGLKGRRECAVTYYPYRAADGQVSHVVVVTRDVTEQVRADRRLADALEAARKASRAKSELLSSMSHELRTPMNAILGFAQLLDMDARLDPEQRDNVMEILKAGRHLLALINEVLDLSRVESGRVALRMEAVAITELIDECAALVESGAVRQGLTFRRELEPCADRRVRADRLRIKQVLLNLLSNAVKYNRHGGEVRVSCDLAVPGRVRLLVSDTGLGIAEDQQAGLFTAFHRLGREDSDIEGTGIGLAISRKLVELMDGTIGMESRVGQGSTFWVDLPEADADAPPGEGVRGGS